MTKNLPTQSADSDIGKGFKFVDLFAGMGGFHKALESLGAECVFASEINRYARATYAKTFKDSPVIRDPGKFNKDLTEITRRGSERSMTGLIEDLDEESKAQIESSIDDFDVLCAGFPCQPFSQVGHKKGFGDTRGNLFCDIERILRVKKPAAIFLENVRNLLKHDDENTITEIRRRLDWAGYGNVWTPVVWASEHGLPQHRPRVFILGFNDEKARQYFERNMPKSQDLFHKRNPESVKLRYTMSDIFGREVVMGPSSQANKRRDIGFTLRVGGRMSPIDSRQNWDCYLVDGKPERLKPAHGLMMQGFTESIEDGESWFPDSVNEVQAMKLLGNSVAVPAIRDYAKVIFMALRTAQKSKQEK